MKYIRGAVPAASPAMGRPVARASVIEIRGARKAGGYPRFSQEPLNSIERSDGWDPLEVSAQGWKKWCERQCDAVEDDARESCEAKGATLVGGSVNCNCSKEHYRTWLAFGINLVGGSYECTMEIDLPPITQPDGQG
jgi:hypothetical protein